MISIFNKIKIFLIQVLLVIFSVLCSNLTFATEDGTVICTITCTNIVFTAFNPYDATFEKANGSIVVRCASTSTASRSITYYIGAQGGNSTNYSARVAKNGTNSISYNIYLDSGYTQVLGDTSNGTSYITAGYTLTANGSRTDNYPIYGKIPVQPLAKPMTYTDTFVCGVQYTY